MFRDRAQAGEALAAHMLTLLAPGHEAELVLTGESGIVVLGIPRGGVVVAAPVARALGAALDVVVPRKVGAPGEPELAVGAVALVGGEEIAIFDDESVQALGVPRRYLEEEVARQKREIARRVAAYREGRAACALKGRVALVVDDGVATGLTARAAAEAVKREGARAVIVAVPVAPPETVRTFARLGLRLEALRTPTPFLAVGRFYDDFRAVEDDEVCALLRSATP